MKITEQQLWDVTNNFLNELYVTQVTNVSAVQINADGTAQITSRIEVPFSATSAYNPYRYYYIESTSASTSPIQVMDFILVKKIFDYIQTSTGSPDVVEYTNSATMVADTDVKKGDYGIDLSAGISYVNKTGSNGAIIDWSEIAGSNHITGGLTEDVVIVDSITSYDSGGGVYLTSATSATLHFIDGLYKGKTSI